MVLKKDIMEGEVVEMRGAGATKTLLHGASGELSSSEDIAVPGLIHRACFLDMEGWVGISWRVGTACVCGQAKRSAAAGCCQCQAAAE